MQNEHRRILVPAHEFALHPINTVKSLIGLDAEVKSVKQNEIYREDGLLIVDVEYSALEINPSIIHFVKKSDVKPVSPDSQDHGVKINGLNVLIDMSNVEKNDYKEYYPIQIMRKDFIEDRKYFQYYGKICTKPLGYLCSPFMCKNLFEFPPQTKLYGDKYTPKTTYTDDVMIKYYTYELKKFGLLANITNVEKAKTFEDCKNSLTGYLITWAELKKQKMMQGIILIQPIRVPDVVLFIPSSMFMIKSTDIENIDKFLEFSKINWLNYCYITSA